MRFERKQIFAHTRQGLSGFSVTKLLKLTNLTSKNRHLIQMGIDLEEIEKHEEALSYLNEVLTEHSEALAFDVALALYFKGCILEKLNKIDEMVSCYLQLVGMNLEKQDVETIIYVYEKTLKQTVPKQMRFLSSDIPPQTSFYW